MRLPKATRRPYSVILDLTARCNLKCVMCYFSGDDRLGFKPFDRAPGRDLLPLDVFEAIARDVFPRAHKVALGCAAEPMIHPRFTDALDIASQYRIPDLWFPTNLLPLTERSARAIVDARVNTVAASIDGVTEETYESIRTGGRFKRLLSRLDLFNEVRSASSSRRKAPQLRIIFTWMKANRDELRALPEFAAKHGAKELDVRFVSLTEGVDNTPQLLDQEAGEDLRADLRATAKEALARGLRLVEFPEFEVPSERPTSLQNRVRRRLNNFRLGLESWQHWRQRWWEAQEGCALPARTLVIRPNGAVMPCVFWEQDPIGFYPEDTLDQIASGQALTRIKDGLKSGAPVGSCAGCNHRKDAFYRPFRKRLPIVPLASETNRGASDPTAG